MKGHIVKNIPWSLLFTLSLILLYLPMMGNGQTVDALEKVLTTKRLTSNEKIKVYQELSEKYSNLNIQKSLGYARAGLVLAAEDKEAQVLFYQSMSLTFLKGAVYDSASHYLSIALPIAQEIKNSKLEGTLNRVYGSLYSYQNKYDQAMDYYKKSAVILEKLNNSYELCQTYAGIGGVYTMLDNDETGLEYYKKAEDLAIKSGNRERLAGIYSSLGSIYRNQDKSMDESVAPIKKAVKIYHELFNTFGEIQALATLANTYSYYDDNAAALPVAKQALKLAQDGKFPDMIATCATILSAIHYYLGQYSESIVHARTAIQVDSNDVNISKHAYIHLSLAHGQLGQMDSMEHYVNQFFSALQEQYNENFHNAISEMEVKYGTEKKALKITALEKQRQYYTWLGITGIGLLVLAAVIGIIRYRLVVSKRKLVEEQNTRLVQEKQLVAVQATLDGETAERTRLARDLHDGLGSMLSAVKMNLPQVEGNVVLEAQDVSRFQKALGMLDDSIQELRRVAHHMMPDSLLRYGLKVSLSDFCAAIPTAQFHYFGIEGRLAEKLEIMVYRCIHELVNNALKHAEATQINVQLIQEEDRISFTVQDNGKGFDPNTVPKGMGLQNIQQRVEAFQGRLEIYSSDKGTEIQVELELTKINPND